MPASSDSNVEAQRKLALALAELKSRGLSLPEGFSSHNTKGWPLDENGFFVRDDGKHYSINPETEKYKFIFSTARYVALGGGRGSGKALAVDTPILTTLGWKTIGDVVVGDIVFSESGQPTKILNVSDVMYGHTCYEITFSDGAKLIADEDHQWWVRTITDRKIGNASHIITTGAMARKYTIGKTCKLSYVYSIDTCGPVEFDRTDLLVDPYLLGLWLGDGNSREATITIGEEDSWLVDKIQSLGYPIHKLPEYCMWSLGNTKENKKNLQRSLRAMGVLRNKHIPDRYLRGSVEQRLQLLWGLMDSDGSVSRKGNCSFSNSNSRLAHQVEELLLGLGIKVSVSTYKTNYKGKSGKDTFHLMFTPTIPVCSLPRKLGRQRLDSIDGSQYHRMIVNIKKVFSVPVRCIVVDSPNHVYVVGKNFIPTHNSGAGSQKALKKIEAGENGAVINPDFANFCYSTWPEFRRWIPWNMVIPSQRHRRDPSWQPRQPFVMVFMNGVQVTCKGLKNPDSARGPNMNWVWYDEGGRDNTGMSWNLLIASVRVGKDPCAWVTTTPNGMDHWLYDFFIKQNIPEEIFKLLPPNQKLIEYYQTSIEENKDNLDPAYYASMLAAYPTGWLRDQELYGKFTEKGGHLGDPAWFVGKYLPEVFPTTKRRVRYWDLAATEKDAKHPDPDHTVGTLMSWDGKENYCVENQTYGQWRWDKIKSMIVEVALVDGPYVEIFIEQEPGSGGKNQVVELASMPELAGYKVTRHEPEGDKVMRANTWFADAALGHVFLVKDEWNEPFMMQLSSFPSGRHDDRIDSVSGARQVINPFRKWKRIEFLSLSGNTNRSSGSVIKIDAPKDEKKPEANIGRL